MTSSEWLGTIGVGMILLAYLLSTFQVVKVQDITYILLNLLGAGLACIASTLIVFIPFIVLEGLWTFVSLVALVNYVRNKYDR